MWDAPKWWTAELEHSTSVIKKKGQLMNFRKVNKYVKKHLKKVGDYNTWNVESTEKLV